MTTVVSHSSDQSDQFQVLVSFGCSKYKEQKWNSAVWSEFAFAALLATVKVSDTEVFSG
jgi:hypothetical protein